MVRQQKDSRDFSRCWISTQRTIPRYQSTCVFPPHPVPVECLAVIWECRAATMGRQVFGTRMVYRETFCKSNSVFTSTLSAESRIHGALSIRTHITACDGNKPNTSSWSEMQSGPSARSSVVPSEGGFSKNFLRDHNDCKFQILILTNSPRQQRSLVLRWDLRLRYALVHNFLRKLCCGSKKWSWLIQWMI